MIYEFRKHMSVHGTALAALLVFFLVSCVCGALQCQAVDELYESRLDEGLSTTEPYSAYLITLTHQNRSQAKELLQKARHYSPDLPAVYFEMAKEGVGLSPNALLQGLDYFREGVRAYGRNFWWAFTLVGLTTISLFLSFLLALLAVLVIRSPLDGALVMHEGREEKKRLALLAIPLVLSLLGPVAFAAGAFFLIGLYFKKENKALVYASLLFFAASPFLTKEMSPFLSLSPSLNAIVAVNEGKDNRYALWVLKGRDDFPSAFSYALALKREGRYREAIEAYKEVAGRLKREDPRVLINVGNAFYGIKDMDAAKEAYQKALAIYPFPSAYYNLSQVYREMLDFTKGDEYFQKAAQLSPEAITRFTSIAGTNPNRFVVDETLPLSALWEYAVGRGGRSFSALDAPVFLLAVLMIAGFFFLSGKFKYRAQRCKRCGAVFCSKCSRTVAWGEMCSRCFVSFLKIDEIDPGERVSRLLSIYQRQSKRRTVTKVISFVIPGAGHVYSGKILVGFLFLWVFLLCSVVLVLNLFFPSPGIVPFSQGWITLLMLFCMALCYAGALFHIRRRIHKGWL